MDRDWSFLVDENLEPQIARFLEKEGYRADHVNEALTKGADDVEDVLPYARGEGLVVVTADLKDFGSLDENEHEGLLLLGGERYSAFRIAGAVMDVVDAYGDRDQFTREFLDSPLLWLEPADV